jgi:hypothetical protein
MHEKTITNEGIEFGENLGLWCGEKQGTATNESKYRKQHKPILPLRYQVD